jgi:hypothetical protein|tara:strand:- start:85 stop:468 length:384 start_codon:yes stop_codon:yes gene_type:complete
MSKLKNPFKKVLENVKGTQYVSSKTFSESGQVMRRVKEVCITELDIQHQFEKQNGLSHFLKIPIDPYDVFRVHYPLAPSVDRIDNTKDYYPNNIVINTRFENNGLNRCDPKYMDYIKEYLIKHFKNA